MEERIKNNTDRIITLEAKVQRIETRMAVAENNIDTINRKLDKIDANISKLLWIVITFVILAVLGYVFAPPAGIKTAGLFLIGGY
jgi:hypothetical protein